MNTDKGLKPCPFCGANPELVEKDAMTSLNGCDGYDVMCKTSGCYLEEGADYYLEKDLVIEAWNTRTKEEDGL